MNQKNCKNSLGLDRCFEDLENPIDLFKKWFAKAKDNEINDPNALALATSDNANQPSVRMFLLKDITDKGFVFYTNFESRKSRELKNAKDSDTVYKSSGPILVKKTKAAVVKDLEEKKELANARAVVLAKQEKRMKDSLQDMQTKINESIKSKSNLSES